MNAPKRLKARLPLIRPDDFDIASIIPIFHRWIQNKSVPGLLIDVADYKHVPSGPGIFLIGDEGDYSLDQADGRLSLVYDRKRQTGTELSESVHLVMEGAMAARRALEAETELGLRVADEPIQIVILDRLQYPNNAEIFDSVKGAVKGAVALDQVHTATDLTYVATDPRRPLTIEIQLERTVVAA